MSSRTHPTTWILCLGGVLIKSKWEYRHSWYSQK